ncbi:unnamed protein product, partial [Effrenium voratum]
GRTAHRPPLMALRSLCVRSRPALRAWAPQLPRQAPRMSSKAEAVQLSAARKFQGPETAHVLQFLSPWCQGEALSRALKRHPELLAAEERRMKASAAVLQQLLAEETFSRTMRECPEALLAEAADLLELGRVFADYEVSLDKVVQRSPRLLLCKAQQVRNILGFLQDEPSGPGMSREQVGEVAERFPMLLLGCRNVEQQLAPLVSFLRSLGVDPKCAACRGFYAWPEAHKVLEPTARYLLDECGYGPKELAENVDVLGYSLEARIYPRGRFLQHLKTRLPLRVHAAADDFQFCQLLGVRREQFLEFALDLRREMRTNAALQSRGARGGQEPKPRVAAVARFERRPGQKPSEPLESSSFALSFGLPLRSGAES